MNEGRVRRNRGKSNKISRDRDRMTIVKGRWKGERQLCREFGGRGSTEPMREKLSKSKLATIFRGSRRERKTSLCTILFM